VVIEGKGQADANARHHGKAGGIDGGEGVEILKLRRCRRKRIGADASNLVADAVMIDGGSLGLAIP
jgi:hypothetical protein